MKISKICLKRNFCQFVYFNSHGKVRVYSYATCFFRRFNAYGGPVGQNEYCWPPLNFSRKLHWRYFLRRLEISNSSLGGPGGPNQSLNSQIDVVWRALQRGFTSFFELFRIIVNFWSACLFTHIFPLRVPKNSFPLRVKKQAFLKLSQYGIQLH